jgi:hypothetical protein
VFETCEDLEDLDGLHVLHNIMKSISKTNHFELLLTLISRSETLNWTVLLNDNNIIEHVIKDEIILGVVGILECR